MNRGYLGWAASMIISRLCAKVQGFFAFFISFAAHSVFPADLLHDVKRFIILNSNSAFLFYWSVYS